MLALLRGAEALVTPGMTMEDAKARIEADPIGPGNNVVAPDFDCGGDVADGLPYGLFTHYRGGDRISLMKSSIPKAILWRIRRAPCRFFNLTLTRCVKALLEHFPAETLKPGDVLVTNDPWLCAGHLFDIALVTPVFHQVPRCGADGYGRSCKRYWRCEGPPGGRVKFTMRVYKSPR